MDTVRDSEEGDGPSAARERPQGAVQAPVKMLRNALPDLAKSEVLKGYHSVPQLNRDMEQVDLPA